MTSMWERKEGRKENRQLASEMVESDLHIRNHIVAESEIAQSVSHQGMGDLTLGKAGIGTHRSLERVYGPDSYPHFKPRLLAWSEIVESSNNY